LALDPALPGVGVRWIWRDLGMARGRHRSTFVLPAEKELDMKRIGRRATSKIVLAIAVVVAATTLLAPAASARLVPPGDSPFGHTYASWHVVWGKAMARRSLESRNSLLALRGNRCGFAWSQRVWLLPVSINGLITANCRIPADKYLVFPIAGIFGWGEGPETLRQDVREGFKLISSAKLSVDGRSLRPGFVTRTPAFVGEVPAGNAFGEPAGLLSMMFKSYFVVLSPLSKGEHTITTLGTFSDDPSNPLGMTYRLTVR
jgi:hypothetical protein